MTDTISRYFTELQARLDCVAEKNHSALERAAEVCADALASRHVIHLYDTGHIISHEMIARTGGLVAYTPLSFGGRLENYNLYRARQQAPADSDDFKAEKALLAWVFGQDTLRPGDVLIAGSVSGTGRVLVELVLEARQRGLTVIALTAPAHSERLQPSHPSGKRLFEAADIVLDNGADYGDSFFAVDSLDRKVAPVSGVSAAVLMWALTVAIVDRLVRRGITPSVYTSVNLPGGPQAVEEIEARYAETGY